MNGFSVETREDEQGRAVIAPRGELDLETHSEFSRAISQVLSTGQAHIVVDLAETTFMDSTSLGTLISAQRRTDAAGGSLTILCRNERFLRLFEITSLDTVFTIVRD